MDDKYQQLREALKSPFMEHSFRDHSTAIAALLAERDALHSALKESDNQLREVLASISDERVHHDGDEFHQALAANSAALSL